jgi:hypothetical protein
LGQKFAEDGIVALHVEQTISEIGAIIEPRLFIPFPLSIATIDTSRIGPRNFADKGFLDFTHYRYAEAVQAGWSVL